MSKYYNAPWSGSLTVISSLATLLCVGATLGMAFSSRGMMAGLALLPLVICLGSALFMIRGYTTTSDAILIHRMFWSTRLPLVGLRSVEYEPEAMRWSIRIFGNGGFFSFTGLFRNKQLGVYRAFVTHPRRTVVLRYADRRVVLSPATPEEFVRDLTKSGKVG